MHFVARNTTDHAYSAQGYSLRPNDPLALFKQPPTHVKRGSGIFETPPTHRRSASGGSLKHIHFSNKDSSISPAFSETEQMLRDEPSVLLDTSPKDETHDCQIEGCKRVTINIAGQKYETQLRTLNRLPSTLLGSPSKRERYWDEKRQEYFFDRHRPSFPAILYYYQSGGRLKRPVEVPLDIFLEELSFFELGDQVIVAFKNAEGCISDLDVDDDDLPESSIQRVIWETFENPGSTIISNIIAILSVVFILTSVVIFCMETLPQFKNADCKNETIITTNGTVVEWVMRPNYFSTFFVIESCCITWFVFELMIRMIASPSKIKFFKTILNWIDLASIAPYFIFLLMSLLQNKCTSESQYLAVLRVLRVIRIFKLSRFSTGLQILGKTLRVSLRELSMFVLFLAIGVVIFAGAIYYAEAQTDNSYFTSIPDAFWWAVISMTTVGYGDVYPIGVFGKIIGSMCVLTGLLAIALPVPVIVTNFNNIYRSTTGRGNAG